MVQLLKCKEHAEGEEFLIRIDQLHSLRDVGILTNPDARKAMRGVSQKQVERLMFSDPNEWPPIVVVLTDRGWAIVDGYHRRDAMKYKGLKEIKAECREFESEVAVIQAAYRANRKHGLPIPAESRSAYACYLHTVFPEMTQEELGHEAGISQPAVSIALSRREKAAEQKAPKAQEKPPDQLITKQPEPLPEEKRHESALQDWQTITRDIRKLLEDTQDDELTRRAAMMEALTNIQDRDFLLEVAREIQAALAPPPAPPPTRRKK
jgi:ParB-like nuclease family protein